MQQGDLVSGRRYAVRMNANRTALVKVTFLGAVHKGQAKVRFETGDLSRLEDWVATREIICAWSERKAMLEDEARDALKRDADKHAWDHVYAKAISAVFVASGEETGYASNWYTLEGLATRLWARADLPGSPLGDNVVNYEDRHDRWHLSFETALKLARAFAAQEPDLVELYLREWEDRERAEGFQPGNRHMHRALRENAPAFAMARSWTKESALTALQVEIDRLHTLVKHAIGVLQGAGLNREAMRLRLALAGS